MKKLPRLVALALACLWVSSAEVHAQNVTITYQGRVMVNGSPFTGAGQFKFALVTSTDASTPATATATVSFGFVVNIAVNSGGNGYATPPAVTISGGGGSGATATATVGGGMVTGIVINNNGSGYASTPTVIIAPPPASISYVTYWSNDGTSVAGSQPTAAVGAGVTSGLLTVPLGDTSLPNMSALSAALFTQANLQLRIWFNDGVNGFAALSPVQNLTAAPTAAFAYSAGTVTNGAITSVQLAPSSVGAGNIQNNAITANKIAAGQVVRSLNALTEAVTLAAGTNITLGVAGNTITIAGQTGGLSWQVVTSSNQQAQPNTGYIAANDSAVVTITLPPAPNVGDLIRVAGTGLAGWAIGLGSGQTILGASSNALQTTTPAGVTWTPTGPSANWSSVASSSNGTKLVAVGTNALVYTSTNSGATWVQRSFNVDPLIASSNWAAVASSADGVKLVAGINGGTNGGGEIGTSSDSGATWSIHDPFAYWQCVASSSDGVKLVGGASTFGPHSIYTSINSGLDWTGPNGISPSAIKSVASSSDGVKLAAAGYGVYTSADSGANWTDGRDTPFTRPQAIACSADGSKLVAAVNVGQIYTSSDSGATWATRAFVNTWQTVASSADGLKLVAAAFGGQIYTSTNAGASWTAHDSNRNWVSVASSTDGNKLVAVVAGGQIYTSQATTSISGGQGSAVELMYAGNNQFILLSSNHGAASH